MTLRELSERPWFKRVGYLGFGGLAFLFSLYLTFPAEAVGQRLSHEAAKATNGAVNLTFDDVSLYRMTGFAARGVRLKRQVPGKEPFETTIDGVRVRLELLPLLWLSVEGTGVIELGGGELAFDLGKTDEGFEVALDADAWSFADPPVIPKLLGFPVVGVLGGKTEASVTPADLGKSAGKSSLTIHDASLGPGEIASFKVPQLGLGQLDLALDMQNGRLRIAAFQQRPGEGGKKPDLEIKNITGTLTLRGGIAGAAYDVCIEAKPSDALIARDATFKAAASLAEMQFKKDGQGFIHIPLKGNVGGNPRPGRNLCRPAGRDSGDAPARDKESTRGGGRPGPKGGAPADPDMPADKPTGLDGDGE